MTSGDAFDRAVEAVGEERGRARERTGGRGRGALEAEPGERDGGESPRALGAAQPVAAPELRDKDHRGEFGHCADPAVNPVLSESGVLEGGGELRLGERAGYALGPCCHIGSCLLVRVRVGGHGPTYASPHLGKTFPQARVKPRTQLAHHMLESGAGAEVPREA
jgi:hypothetical protein